MRLTTKFLVSVTLLAIVVMIMILLTATLGIYYANNTIIEQDLKILATAFDKVLSTNAIDDTASWLAIVMESHKISDIYVVNVHTDSIKYHFEYAVNRNAGDSFFSTKQFILPLINNDEYQMRITYVDPVFRTIFSSQMMWTMGVVIVAIASLLMLMLNWMKPKFKGILLLEERARSILTGDRNGFVHEQSCATDEWPKDASKALDLLLQERQKRSKERTHVDTLIRAFFAQDAQTGVRSRLSFEHQLAIHLEEINAHGVVMMVRLPDFELQTKPTQRQSVDELQETLINILSTFVARYPSALLARYFNNDFAILLPHISLKDADNMASQLIQSVNSLSVDPELDKDTLMYIGITAYCSGQYSEMILDYVNQATRNAELQGSNGWFIYDNNIPKVVLGSVRWRTLLTQVLDTGNGLRFYEKAAITIEGKLHHREIMTRVYDGRQELLAAEFIPWLHQLRLADKFDRKIVERLLPMLDRWSNETIAITINVESLLQTEFFTWLQDVLQMKGPDVCGRILFELLESDVARYADKLEPIIQQLKQFGCKIGITQAGLTVVSTDYLQQLPFDVIKLYSGLVRHIKMRPENQLIVESLCGACADTNILIFATGVRTHSEWEVLCDKGISGGQGDLFAPLERLPI